MEVKAWLEKAMVGVEGESATVEVRLDHDGDVIEGKVHVQDASLCQSQASGTEAPAGFTRESVTTALLKLKDRLATEARVELVKEKVVGGMRSANIAGHLHRQFWMIDMVANELGVELPKLKVDVKETLVVTDAPFPSPSES